MPRGRTLDRRFSLADLMVLVAATGAGLAILRPYREAMAGPNWQNASPHLRTIETLYGAWSCVAACWMLALLALRLRRPRPGLGRLLVRPGHVACCVAAAALALGGLHELVRIASRDPNRMPDSYQQLWITVSSGVGPTVAGAWLLLALGGRWRPDPGWIDRLGRLLGCCWIGWILLWTIPTPIRMRLIPW